MIRSFALHRIRAQPVALWRLHVRSSSSVTHSGQSQIPTASLDISAIIKDADLHSQNCVRRLYGEQSNFPQEIAKLRAEDQQLEETARGQREEVNRLEKRIKTLQAAAKDGSAVAKTEGEESESLETLIGKKRCLNPETKEVMSRQKQLRQTIHNLALQLPNLTATESLKSSADSLRVIRRYNAPERITDAERPPAFHTEIGAELDLLDFTSSSKTSGWGYYFLKNQAVLLEQALIQYSLQTAAAKGWEPVAAPSVVYNDLAHATGFRPRDRADERQIFSLEDPDLGAEIDGPKKPRMSLAATAEIPIAGMLQSTTLKRVDLPKRVVGVSRCYRAEAGGRGVDTKGLYRVHEFSKVELFAWLAGDKISQSTAMLNEIIELQEQILKGLELSYRVLEMPPPDLGASAYRKIDIEVLFPSRKDIADGWGEVTSASICTDYQSRRLKTRVEKLPEEEKQRFAHTLNGTAIAVPRVIMAILENGWNSGTREVILPRALHQLMGMESIKKTVGKHYSPIS